MSGAANDPRLAEVLRLLRAIAEDPLAENPLALAEGALAGPPGAVSDDRRAEHLLTSATDLLVPWGPEPDLLSSTSGGPVPAARWDAYFGGAPARPAPARPPREQGASAPIRLPSAAFAEPARDLPDDTVEDEAAEAVIDSLFDLLHALERGEVDEAMRLVSPDFHSMRHSQGGLHEIDRDGLRLEFDRFVDEHRERRLRLRLSRVPEPVAHPLGVLVWAPLTLEEAAPAEGEEQGAEPFLFQRAEHLALFVEQPDGSWLLGALAPVGREEEP